MTTFTPLVLVPVYGLPKTLDACLRWLDRSAVFQGVVVTVMLADNSTEPADLAATKKVADKWKKSRALRVVHEPMSGNKGFSGASNRGRDEVLASSTFSHLVILNSDALVPETWMSDFAESPFNVTGVVTNRAGNIQQLPVGLDLDEPALLVDDAIQRIRAERIAATRRVIWRGQFQRRTFVTFLMVGVDRKTLEHIGALDEQFWPGGYEDDDYCRRVIKAERSIGISEATFVFHLGSASFGQFGMEQRLRWDAENRSRFELLHGPFQSRSHEVGERAQADAVRRVELISGLLLDCTADERRVIVTTLGMASAEVSADDAPDRLDPPAFAPVTPTAPRQPPRWLTIFRRIVGVARNAVSVFQVVLPLRADVLVLAGRFPRDADLLDGYFVRVRLIDQLLQKSKLSRVYLNMGAATNEAYFMAPTVVEVSVKGRLSSGIALTVLMLNTRFTYAHSILRLPQRILSIITLTRTKLILDVHGVVPEEALMQGDEQAAQLLDGVEARALKIADAALCVTTEMVRHLVEKHMVSAGKFTVLPIFDLELRKADSAKFHKRKTDFTYVGGMQPWQNLDSIRDRIIGSGDLFSWKFIVPNPGELRDRYPELADFRRVTVLSARGPELGKHLRATKFGLLPRARSVVNSVAFPTKIVDYLSYGCVPATLNAPIGGIADLDVHRKVLPATSSFRNFSISQEEWERKARANSDAFSKLDSIVNSTAQLFFAGLK